jgi:hypothetical protein
MLEAAMPGELAINEVGPPRAVVVAGERLDASALPASGPVSFVLPPKPRGPDVRLVSVTSPRAVLPGWSAVVTAEIAGSELEPGTTALVVLESKGIEVDRVEHKWSRRDDRFVARLAFAPPSAGSFSLTLRVDQSTVPVRVVAEQRRLKILAFDPRPSWASGFVRRALEEDPDFDVVARVRASRGLDVRTGAPPAVLSAESLNPFDLTIVGAPEDLTSNEVDALETFARRRGGTVVLMADRKPTGAYVRLVGVEPFDEVLVEKPIRLTVPAATTAPTLRGSEFAYPRVMPAGGEALLTISHAGSARAPVVSLTLGAGRVVFSVLLDAWRYRDDDGDAFGAFWRSHLGWEAARAPRRLEVGLQPASATPGTAVRVRAAIRATDQVTSPAGVAIPAISARLVDERGAQRFVRLWPASEPGVFDGNFVAPAVGRYDVQVQTDAGTTTDTSFVVSDGPPVIDVNASRNSAELVARATGGVMVTAENLDPLVKQLRALDREMISSVRYPMRSMWWAVAFAGLLSSEWLTRRRRGLR